MKFTDGYWLLREGVTAAHPVEVLDVTARDARWRSTRRPNPSATAATC